MHDSPRLAPTVAVRTTIAFQPRRLMMAPAAVGCKRWLGGSKWSLRWRETNPSPNRCRHHEGLSDREQFEIHSVLPGKLIGLSNVVKQTECLALGIALAPRIEVSAAELVRDVLDEYPAAD